MKTLLLWDIDGTLLASSGAGLRALVVALRSEFGIEGHLDDIDWSGRTDRYIARQYFFNVVALLVLLFSFVVVVDLTLNIDRMFKVAGEFAKDPAKAQDAKALEYALQRQALFRQAVRIDQ